MALVRTRLVRAIFGRNPMSNGSSERVPFWQAVLDNHFLLLFLGVASPTLLYILWGVMELANIPIAK